MVSQQLLGIYFLCISKKCEQSRGIPSLSFLWRTPLLSLVFMAAQRQTAIQVHPRCCCVPPGLCYLSEQFWGFEVLTAQLCPTLCYPMDCSPPGSSVHGTLQARILEWVATSLSRGSSWVRNQTYISHGHLQACSLPLVPLGKPKNMRLC